MLSSIYTKFYFMLLNWIYNPTKSLCLQLISICILDSMLLDKTLYINIMSQFNFAIETGALPFMVSFLTLFLIFKEKD